MSLSDSDQRLRQSIIDRLAPPRSASHGASLGRSSSDNGGGPIDLILDTDTYNEIDDQFALVYALLSSAFEPTDPTHNRLNLKAVYAAPFLNSRGDSPADGMQKSYEEIERVFSRLPKVVHPPFYKGSTTYLSSLKRPVESPAAFDLIERAKAQPEGKPLYVVAIGAITNVASALLIDPSIIDKIVVVWLGGETYYWKGPQSNAFNLYQDIESARVVFDSKAPFVHVPCNNVTEHLRTTLPEVAYYVRPQGAIGEYLYSIFEDYYSDHYARSKEIWDVGAIAYLVNPDWTPSSLRPSPLLNDDLTWGPVDESRHLIRELDTVRRDRIFADLFRKIERYNAL